MTDYTQLAQAKAKKKYKDAGPHDNYSDARTVLIQRQAYIDALNDVKGLVEAGKELVRLKNIKEQDIKTLDEMNDYVNNKKAAWGSMRAAIEQFEKIEK